jgi:acetyl-CoA carboxylase carboxyl transferase subunit beta
MQLAKTIGALERLRAAGVPFISVLSDPTTGGVFASFAALGDINIAEPNALIGFAGARVSAGTIAQELPAGFQRSEFLFEHGFLDRVVHRAELRSELAALLGYLVPISRRDGFAEEPEPLGLPSFRPLSFLTNLAERVLPGDSEPAPPPQPPTNGNLAASAAALPPVRPEPGPAPATPATPATPDSEASESEAAPSGEGSETHRG